MYQYAPLFFVAAIAIIFATIQDIKSREVANWANFSLLAFALAYRAVYSVQNSEIGFLAIGLFSLGTGIVLANALYYSKVFAGGDAKLFIALSAIIPASSISESLIKITIATFVLFAVGAIYSILYSFGIAIKNKKKFKANLKEYQKKYNWVFAISGIGFFITVLASFLNPLFLLGTVLFFIPFLSAYIKSVDKCMVVTLPPKKLAEGDWLNKEIKLKNCLIKKSVHGLSYEEIELLKRINRSVEIKEGVPFIPAFFITFVIMALFGLDEWVSLVFSLI